MKALQTRSPINLFYEYPNISRVNLSIWVSDTINIDTTTTPDYQLSTSAIEDLGSFEISELIRSKNQYIFNEDFYTKRDTAKYVLVKSNLLTVDDPQLTINNFKTRVEDDFGTFEAESCLLETFNPEVKYDLFRVRDGYLQRVESPQIYDNTIPTNITTWETITNADITKNQTDAFNGSDAYLVKSSNNSAPFFVKDLNLKGLHTFSFFIKRLSGNLNEYVVGTDLINEKFIVIDTDSPSFLQKGDDIISYDIIEFNNWNLVSFCVDYNNTTDNGFRIESLHSDQEFYIFNPKVTKGNTINQEAGDLILQDNTSVFSDGLIDTKVSFDRKLSNQQYQYDSFSVDLRQLFSQGSDVQSVSTSVDNTANLNYIDLSGDTTSAQIAKINLDECKFTPTKVSFINRFGVIQDLVFFKKREDNIQTDKESYKANVLQRGQYYSHIGQNQTIRKESKGSVTLNTGFYPEEFNTVFEQLQNSLHYWIDDEPANLEGSQLQIKTRVNDKLINYTFDFSYSNEEVNTI